jgi:hypothetical protein
MRNIADKSVQKIKTHILRSETFSQSRTVHNVEKYGRAGKATATIRYGACTWHTAKLRLQMHPQDTQKFIPFPQQRLGERASVLHYTYNVRLVVPIQHYLKISKIEMECVHCAVRAEY